MDQIKIGAFIQRTRKARNLTQRELAERLGISDKPVCKFLLRHPLSLAQGIQEVSEIVQSSTSQIFCTIIVSRSRAAVKYRW